MENTERLTIKEIAAKFKVPVSWFYSRTRETGEGSIPRIKVGKYLRFNEAEVTAWINEKYGE